MNRTFVYSVSTGAALAGLMTVGVAFASGPFDGQWNGHTFYNNKHCITGDFPVTVADNKFEGVWKGIRGTYPVSGTIAPDGTVTGTVGKGRLTGKFAGDNFEGTFPPFEQCGPGHAVFERAK
jgi:hypothetical protein